MATIEKRGKAYRITVSLGYDVDGKQIKERMTWTPDPGMSERAIKIELNKVAVRFEDQCRQRGVRGGNIRLDQFAEQWFTDYAEQQLKPRTVAHYRFLYQRVRQGLGHLQLEKITPRHLTAFYSALSEEGIRADVRYLCKQDFKAYMAERGMKQAELVTASGLGSTTVEKLYAGKPVALKTAQLVCDALHVKLAALFVPEDTTPLSGKTMLHYHRFISSMLETAIQWQMISENPCSRIKAPRSDTGETRYLDEAEAAQLIQALDGEPPLYRTAVLLLLNTGLRRGELCALQWSDLDFEKGTLQVRQSATYLAGQGVVVDTPKTHASARVIRLPASCIPMLRQYRAAQLEARLSVGDQWEDNDFVFATWNGKALRPDTLTKWFRKFIDRNGLPPITLHGLRHTNATLLIAAGINLRTVSGRLGHSRAATTANIYAHAIQSADAAAADTIDDVLSPKPKKGRNPAVS